MPPPHQRWRHTIGACHVIPRDRRVYCRTIAQIISCQGVGKDQSAVNWLVPSLESQLRQRTKNPGAAAGGGERNWDPDYLDEQKFALDHEQSGSIETLNLIFEYDRNT